MKEPQLEIVEGELVSTCRSAIAEILAKETSIKRAMLPAFTCESVVKPFDEKGIEVCPYGIKENLEIDVVSLAEALETFRPDLILFHSYFGFDTLKPISFHWSKEIKTIEDLTQRLFSSFEKVNADYYVGSIRKWMPIPDGAVVNGVSTGAAKEDDELVEAKVDALRQKGLYIVEGKGAKADFLDALKQAEQLLDSRKDTYAMSRVSKSIYANTDIAHLKRKRRENWRWLKENFPVTNWLKPVFTELPKEVVPFMYPVYVKKGRRAFQQYMASSGVYPTVIWTCPKSFEGKIDDTVRKIYDQILCFHCDQRYSIVVP